MLYFSFCCSSPAGSGSLWLNVLQRTPSDERTPRRTLISVIYAVTVYVSVTSSLHVGLINSCSGETQTGEAPAVRSQVSWPSPLPPVFQRVCGAELRDPEEVQPGIPHPDPGVFWSPGPALGPIRWAPSRSASRDTQMRHLCIDLLLIPVSVQILGKRRASPWRTCQLIRWPKLCRLWLSPSPDPRLSPQWFSPFTHLFLFL